MSVILGVLQNQWFDDPDRVRAMLERDPTFRRRLIAFALFRGCKTGRVLRQVFGELCDDIVWEEASKQVGGSASSLFPADVRHLRLVLEELKPDIVLAFGAIAREGLVPLVDAARLVIGPHPCSRAADTVQRLTAMREAVENMTKSFSKEIN